MKISITFVELSWIVLFLLISAMHLNDKSTKLSLYSQNPLEIIHVRSSTLFPDTFIACSLLSQCNLASFWTPNTREIQSRKRDFILQGIIQLKIIATPCWRILEPSIAATSWERKIIEREQNQVREREGESKMRESSMASNSIFYFWKKFNVNMFPNFMRLNLFSIPI